MFLSRQVSKFRNAGVVVLVWIVDRSHALKLLTFRKMLVFEGEAPVGQFSVAVVEVFVERPGVDDMLCPLLLPDLPVIHSKFMNDNSSVTELLAPNYLASNAINISNTPSGLNLNGPDGLAVDSSGRVWIPNDNGNSVTELSRSSGGTITGGNFASGSFSAPDASAVDQSGNIWTTNTSGNSVTEMIVTGGTVTFVNFSGGSTGFNSPTEIAVDGAGNIWVANYTPNSVGASVTELTKSSGYAVSSAVNLLESPAPGGPQGIAVDKSGNVWIANDLSNSVTELPGVATGLTTLPKLAGAP